MELATRLQRHSELWKTGNSRVQRTAVGGVIFAAVIFFNAIEPYATSAESRLALAGLETERRRGDADLARMNALAVSLRGISKAVDKADWRRHKDELVQRFATGQVAAPQEDADRTVREIATQVRSEVLTPLDAAVGRSGVTGPLAEYPASMKAQIDSWERTNIGQRWYLTLRAKEMTVVELGTGLEAIQLDARTMLARLQQEVDGRQKQSKLEQAKLSADIESKNVEIQKALDQAVPAWAKGLVSPERMVPVYPWVLAGIALYLLGSAILAGRHYHGMASAAGWSQPDRSDPLLSSVWTLAWRGAAGTAITLLSYTAVLATLAYFLNRSHALVGAGETAVWLPNLVLFLALLTVVAIPLRGRSRRVDS